MPPVWPIAAKTFEGIEVEPGEWLVGLFPEDQCNAAWIEAVVHVP